MLFKIGNKYSKRNKHWIGKKHSEESKKKMSLAHKGILFSKEHKKKLSLAKIGKKPKNLNLLIKLSKNKNLIWRKRLSNSLRGANSIFWKGGITSLSKNIRKCFKYREWRSDIFTRDDYICQECGIRGGGLEAHHIKEFNIILKENNIKTLELALNCEELWNINNGKTLCEDCHDKYGRRKCVIFN